MPVTTPISRRPMAPPREPSNEYRSTTWLGASRADSSWSTPSIKHRVWLTLRRIDRRQPKACYVVRPAPGEAASVFGEVRWSWSQRRHLLTIEWDATMSGVHLELMVVARAHGLVDSLSGTACQWSGSNFSAQLTSGVVGTRHSCTQRGLGRGRR